MQKGVSFLAVNLLRLALLTGGLALRLMLLGLSAAYMLMLAPEEVRGAANVPACHTVHITCPCSTAEVQNFGIHQPHCLCAYKDRNNMKLMLVIAQAISDCNTRQVVLVTPQDASNTECHSVKTGCCTQLRCAHATFWQCCIVNHCEKLVSHSRTTILNLSTVNGCTCLKVSIR